MSFSLDRSKTGSPEIPQREECRLLMRAVPDPIFKFSLPWKVCPKPLAGSTLVEIFSAQLQSSECPVGRRRKIRGQKGGKKDEEIMNFSGIQILQILHILIFLLVHFFETFVCRRLKKRCELTCPRPLSALQM